MGMTLVKHAGFLLAIITSVWAISCGEQSGRSLLGTTTSPSTPSTSSLLVATKVPSSGDIEVDLNKPVAITFDGDVQASTVNSTNLVVSSSGAPIAGTWTYNASTRTATFVPTSSYPSGSVITVEARAGVLKTDGSPLTSAQWTFTTVSLADLIAYWRFDGDGSDYSGNNRTATGTNITYDTSIVKQGSASALFDGSSSFLMWGF